MTVIGLDGDGWQVRGCLGDEWRWHISPAKPWDAPGWLPARVPGSVIDDLWRAGEVPDPYVGRNSLALEWVPARAWIYRRRLAVPTLAEGDRAILEFGGVDHAASVFLDGELVYEHEGGFVPFQMDLTPLVGGGAGGPRGGEHMLAVVVPPAPANEPQVGVTSRVRVHKSRMGYGWDFCPRMIHQGIWRPVRLRVEPTPFLGDVAVAAHLAEDLTTGTVTVDADLSGPGHARLTVRVRDGDRLLAEQSAEVTGGALVLSVPVSEPRLWWPNGAGEPVLHRVEVTLTAGDRKTTREYDVGFRRIQLRRNEDAPADALPYTLVVNGRRLYLNGWNWVPIDPLYGVPRPAKLAHLLRLAADAHVNLLRVWGGGLIETPEFYGLCDRLGLLVWQEFSMSSSGIESVPAADAEFVGMMVRQARAIVPRLRHHPSLAIWCGGNELADGIAPLDDSAPVLAALRDVVAELHPDAAWLPTSPSGPAFLHRLDAIAADPKGQHDVHGPWEHQGVTDHYRLYDAGTSLLHSEFGVEGMTNRRTLAALIPSSERWPADKSNPVYAHLGAWWNNEPLVQQTFGHRIGDLDTLRRASQFLQADGLRYAVEANRRRAFRNSGTIPWQFNESYPNAWCTAAVDYRGDPKPAYHAVRRVYRPRHACARLDRQAWAGQAEFRAGIVAWGDTPATVSAALCDSHGVPVAGRSWELTPPPGGAPVTFGDLVADLSAVDTDLFLLDVTLLGATRGGARGGTPNRYLLSRTADLAPVLDLAPATVDVATDVAGDVWRVILTHRDGPVALGLTLEDDRDHRAAGWAVPDDSLFHLLPGESRTVSVTWRDAEAAGRVLRLSGFNVAERVVGVSGVLGEGSVC